MFKVQGLAERFFLCYANFRQICKLGRHVYSWKITESFPCKTVHPINFLLISWHLDVLLLASKKYFCIGMVHNVWWKFGKHSFPLSCHLFLLVVFDLASSLFF
jgi:hypothetical protein